MTAKTLMIQGTGSSVGKSIIVTALCRIMHQDGFNAAPFKSQNMSLNSFVTRDGLEMARAQAVQAEAAGIEPCVDMNPVLLKPEADARSQVVVMGKPWMTISARDYYKHTPDLFSIIEQSLARLRSRYDIVIIEGAGSPAEINLRRFEMVNMSIARLAQSPVLLVGDIDKGGVFASLVGTIVLLQDEERERIKGFIINKFRGDVSILQPGLDYLEDHTGIAVLGVVPYYHNIMIDEEDSIHQPYLHGLFDNERFRRGLLHNIKPDCPLEMKSEMPFREEQYDKLAMIVRQSLDMERIYTLLSHSL
ncbi:MAG: Cobyric acid synthase [Dehalococcoidia bacterium]|nr:Cobyric acid synthase [Chloroflexota bacterium]